MMAGTCIVWAGFTIALKNQPPVGSGILFAVFCMIPTALSIPFEMYEMIFHGVTQPTATGWGILICITICSSILGQLFYLRSVDLIWPGRARMFVNLTPIFLALLAIGILGEKFLFYYAAPLILILSGSYFSQESLSKKKDYQRQHFIVGSNSLVKENSPIYCCGRQFLTGFRLLRRY